MPHVGKGMWVDQGCDGEVRNRQKCLNLERQTTTTMIICNTQGKETNRSMKIMRQRDFIMNIIFVGVELLEWLYYIPSLMPT